MVFEMVNGMWAVSMALADPDEIKIRTGTFYTSMEYNALGVLMHLLHDEMDSEDLLG